MKDPDLTFVIPTYRLRDVAETVDAYDEHFWRNGHDVRLVVFDDGTVANCEKYYALLEANATFNPIYYVGPQEKERFLSGEQPHPRGRRDPGRLHREDGSELPLRHQRCLRNRFRRTVPGRRGGN